MRNIRFSSLKIFFLSVSLGALVADAFSGPKIPGANGKEASDTCLKASTRRDVLCKVGGISSLIALQPTSALADDGDLTSQLFNPDGSLKDGEVQEAKQRRVQLSWDVSENGRVDVDGVNVDNKPSGPVRLTYEYPEKWSDGSNGDEIYFDRSQGTNAKACKRITIFQAPGLADMKRLQKASTIGVAKALDVPETLKRLYRADIISGRVNKKDGQAYYEFDMAAAPETCENSQENLGLGFCPYDNIFLLSATIVNDRLYCIAVECDSTRIWKLASADLKRVRSSFSVEAGA